jgi:hypothetical protein
VTPPPTASSAARVRAATAVPAPMRLPPAPRRVSGPARPAARPERRDRAAEHRTTGAPALLIGLIDHPWLERLIRGRAWIALVATALLGIVVMQVALLRLGAQIGGETAAVNSIQQRNNSIQATIGAIEASRGLGTTASSLDMLYPAPGGVTYLQPNPGDGRLAAERIQSPSAVALAAAAAHPLRALHRIVATTAPTTGAAATGATGGVVGTATAAGTASTTGTVTANDAGTTAAGTTASTATTTGAPTTASTGSPTSAVTQTPPTTADTSPTTSGSGGASATTAAGGTTAPTGTTSGAGATGG